MVYSVADKTLAWSLLVQCYQVYAVSLSIGVQKENIPVVVVAYEAASLSAYNSFSTAVSCLCKSPVWQTFKLENNIKC
jgi:hypothetical protein